MKITRKKSKQKKGQKDTKKSKNKWRVNDVLTVGQPRFNAVKTSGHRRVERAVRRIWIGCSCRNGSGDPLQNTRIFRGFKPQNSIVMTPYISQKFYFFSSFYWFPLSLSSLLSLILPVSIGIWKFKISLKTLIDGCLVPPCRPPSSVAEKHQPTQNPTRISRSTLSTLLNVDPGSNWLKIPLNGLDLS